MTMQYRKGFTLIELLVVVVIIGILATIIISSLSTARSNARVTQTASLLKEIEKGLYAAALAENRNSYWTITELGSGSSISLADMLAINSGPGSEISNYLNHGHTKYFNKADILYKNSETFAPCSISQKGVRLFLPSSVFSQEAYDKLNLFFDKNEANTDCGKIRREGAGGAYRYILSADPNKLEFN